MPTPKRCKLAWYAAGSPNLAFLPLAQLLAHDTVASGELSYMALAMQREQFTYISLLMLAGAVHADPEAMQARMIRGCIATPFTARVRRQKVMLK